MDEKWMRLALAEAAKGQHATYPNPWVGALVVKQGRLLSAAHHEKAGQAHAEVLALRKAGAKAKGATVYVSLEPCNHFGKTPPCTQALLAAGVKRVVAACPDPGRQAGGGMAFLRSQGVDASPRWVLRDAAEALIAPFLFSVRQQRPWVLLKAGMSLDGKLATAQGDSQWITGAAALQDARELRGECDGLLVGAGTVSADDPGLLAAPGSPYAPQRFILDPKAGLDLSQKVFHQKKAPAVWWLVGPKASAKRIKQAQAQGVFVQAFKQSSLDAMLPKVLAWMAGLPIRRLMVEGGGQTLGAFFRLGLAQELRLYVAPLLLGGQDSRALLGGRGPKSLALAKRLKTWDLDSMGDDLRVKALF
jgi:diaminohydroxyphosphoribosylaminopyrimidine deaminase/5-amino-6-(5-phosphoribosylamino)uracil reductase